MKKVRLVLTNRNAVHSNICLHIKEKKVSTKGKNKGQIHIKSAVIFNSQCVKLIKREPVALLASFLSHSFSNTVSLQCLLCVFFKTSSDFHEHLIWWQSYALEVYSGKKKSFEGILIMTCCKLTFRFQLSQRVKKQFLMLSRTKAMGANGSQNISVIHIFIYLTIYLYSNLSLLDLHVSYNKTITMFSVRKLILNRNLNFLLRHQLNGFDVIKSSLSDFPC